MSSAADGARGSVATDRAVTVLFLVTVFLLGLMKLVDTDPWTHLSFGRWIWEHRSIPSTEPFITTGDPFPYNNWLFGLIYYLAYLAGGIDGVVLLKAAIVTAIFGMLFRDALRPYRNWAVALLAMAVAILLVRVRFVERPDTFMMLSLAFSFLALNAYVQDGRRLIYALPLVHMLWANTHTSIALMVVPFGAFLAGGGMLALIERHRPGWATGRHVSFAPAPTAAQLKTIAVLFALSFAASLVSPYFIDQYVHSTGAIASDWWRQEITELQQPRWQTAKLLYVFSALVALSFLVNRRRVSPIDLLAAVPFLVLPFTATRFVWFTAIGAVFLARNLSAAIDGSAAWRRRARSLPAVVAASLAFVVLGAMQILQIRPVHTDDSLEFGLGISYRYLPEGALAYMDERGIAGPVLNVFQWGGYITWRDFPRRKPFIDGRGFLQDDLLEQTGTAFRNRALLDTLRSKYGFEVLMSQYPIVRSKAAYEMVEGDFVLDHPDWALVHWDDLSLTYLRRGGPYDEVIARDEYRTIRPAKGIERAVVADPDARQKLLAELQRNVAQTGSSRGYYFLGALLAEMGRYKEAIEAFAKVGQVHRREAEAGAGDAWAALGKWDEAIAHYERALDIREDAGVYQKLGLAQQKVGDRQAAIDSFERALELNPNLVSVYRDLAGLYRAAGGADRADALQQQAEKAQRDKQGEEHFVRATKAYLSRDYPLAIAEYLKSIEANPLSPVPYGNLGYVYFDSGDLDRAYEYHRKALDIDVGSAISHYGLALVYRARGDEASAIRHWEEYLRLEPAGYYTRRAKEQIEALRAGAAQ
ncbi:MAG TPA: tetratricopeptide repeat protein [Rhodocyclaceae bacterium]|nr:tetratricopeptide repeat protein [Rhodocyclaceae bacterium]